MITILSAAYASAANAAVIVTTIERGDILASPESHPDLWARLDAENITVAPYGAAAAEQARIAALEVPRHAALLALLSAGITEAMIEAAIAQIVNVTERETQRLYFMRPKWRRSSSFVAWGKAQFALTDAQVDALFVAAATMD